MSQSTIRLGIVGACGRGKDFKAACDALPQIAIAAVCDTNSAALPKTAATLGAAESYTDYMQMLDKARLDAVVIATPMHLHVPQALAALQRNMHVLCEVTAGISVEECIDLALACRRSRGVYMMAENYTYMEPNVLVREIARRGLFGTPYFAEGEYIHELKELNETTPWRRRWHSGINGNTYPTHSLGPILQWMPGDRVTSVSCAGSGHHYRDPRGDQYENEDSTITLCRMKSGGLVKLRLDMLSNRPHSMTNYQLQGTDGCYESARAEGEKCRIWLRSRCGNPNQWINLDDLKEEFLPDFWRQASQAAEKAGHGGGDYFEILDFVDAIQGKRPPAIGIDDALDMTLPGLLSQQSIQRGGVWVDVPDSRTWQDDNARPRRQLQMLYPPQRPTPPLAITVAEGYALRQYRPADLMPYIALMEKAGFGAWSTQRVAETEYGILPDGFFVIEHIATHALVASAVARHSASAQHPGGAELGWVATDPAHRGKGLGSAVCAAATNLMIQRGYQRIYLLTDDFRLPAIKVYLKLGYQPFLFAPDMEARWRAIRAQLK